MKFKPPASTVSASKLLLRTLINNLGGSTVVGNAVKLKRQAVYNFEVTGYVPLTQLYSVAKDLNLKIWHLSYYKLLEVHGHDAPHFPTLVKDLDMLSKEDKARILKVYNK